MVLAYYFQALDPPHNSLQVFNTMAVATLSQYYKEHKTNDYLSKTFESNVLHAPGDIHRRTASEENYVRRRVCEPCEGFKTPWGRKYSYGGMNVVQLPQNHRPKGEPPLRMTKGTHHYASALCPDPRGVPVQQFYGKTSLQKSHTRANDELIPSPTKVDVFKENITVKFPQQPAYASHQSSKMTNIIPKFDNYNKATPLSAETPAETPGFAILEKARGSYGRHEITRIPLNTERKPMTWPGGPSYYKILKHANRETRAYYPIQQHENNPIKSYPNTTFPRAVEALKQLRLSQWQTSYQRDYNRDKPDYYMNLDNEETLRKITAGPNARVPLSLMISGDKDRETVEEISGETDRRERLVHFEKLNKDIPMPNELTSQDEMNDIKLDHRTFPLPILKQLRPTTSIVTDPNVKATENERQVKSAIISRPNSDISSVQDWSRSDFIRKFNVKTYNEEETNLYKSTPERKRYDTPEDGYLTTDLFS